jgi:DNA-binding transcriptional regulator YhcF (GntR family)
VFTIERIQIDGERRRKDSVPDLHRQLRDEIIGAIVTGIYRMGERLPTVEELSTNLDISSNTVARVYKELADDGVLNTQGQSGTFVANPPELALLEFGDHLMSPVVRDLRRLGYSEAMVTKLVHRATKRWFIARKPADRREQALPVPDDKRKSPRRRRPS